MTESVSLRPRGRHGRGAPGRASEQASASAALRRRGAADAAGPIIRCESLVRIYQRDRIEVQALQGLDLAVDAGEVVAIVGASGSGKSTLLGILSGLDVPTAGSASVAGWDLLEMGRARRLAYRREVVGFVWQQTARNLVPYLSAEENVELPMAFAGVPRRERRARAEGLLDAVDLGDQRGNRPAELSGGQQQRVAIAVALANEPRVLFADEPTGELDEATGAEILGVFRAVNAELGTTVVIVTHDAAVSGQVQRTIAIRDGRTSSETIREVTVDDEGRSSVEATEYAVLDRAGRVQLPAAYRDALALRDRVRLDLDDDHVAVRPAGWRGGAASGGGVNARGADAGGDSAVDPADRDAADRDQADRDESDRDDSGRATDAGLS